MSEVEDLKNEIRLMSNRLLYMEQSLVAFVAHFGQHGHMIFENGTPTGKPAPFKMPLFRPEMGSPVPAVAAPRIETEVKTLTAPATEKPRPMPTP
jgi:hypothetical protein